MEAGYDYRALLMQKHKAAKANAPKPIEVDTLSFFGRLEVEVMKQQKKTIPNKSIKNNKRLINCLLWGESI